MKLKDKLALDSVEIEFNSKTEVNESYLLGFDRGFEAAKCSAYIKLNKWPSFLSARQRRDLQALGDEDAPE